MLGIFPEDRVRVGINLTKFGWVRVALGLAASGFLTVCAAAGPSGVCARPEIGSAVEQPAEIASVQGVLRVELRIRSDVDAQGNRRYCYLSDSNKIAPTLRVSPGDLLEISLKNEIVAVAATRRDAHSKISSNHSPPSDPCAGGLMVDGGTNLHFHGLAIPPVCHQDETLHTIVAPGAAAFQYRFRIPADTTPGLYWYHPHPHGYAKAQVLGGASGALIVEGLERANPLVAGLPERLFVIRDQELVNPNAAPVVSGAMPPPIVLRDAEGDILNNGTGGGKPAKDLSVNFVAVPYPQYQPATLAMRPGQQELWRILNASAITYLDLQLLFVGTAQALEVVALDGAPTNLLSGKTQAKRQAHALVPPGGRVEFIVTGPPVGVGATLVTRNVDTGPAGENDPTRPLIAISARAITARNDAPSARVLPPVQSSGLLVASAAAPKLPAKAAWIGELTPVRVRHLFFYEEPEDPKNPNSPTKFYLTVEGQANKQFDMNDTEPNVVVQQGTVEDWVIENRTREVHAFHIHQIHFLLTEWNGIPLDEPYLRDVINVGYWDGSSPVYPTARLRMDFRAPGIAGTFLYHCHLLEHQDGGMMGTIRVQASKSPEN
jgi:FtsP/CotA-like multicopper oxidase with cupredoxin domain